MKINPRHPFVALCALCLVACRPPLPAPVTQLPESYTDREFKLLDTDGDGFISRAEHAAGSQRKFAAIDANHDGIVTLAEMEAYLRTEDTAPAEPKMSAADRIKMCDGNGDGELTADENVAANLARFEKLDTNKDGRLSLEECKAGHRQMQPDVKK